jgi:hypothetical protein
MVALGALFAPLAIPVLPETYIRYTKALHLQPPRIEAWKLGPLPQIFADQFGWKGMVAASRPSITTCRPKSVLKPPSSRRITDKPEPSTCSVRNAACRPPSVGAEDSYWEIAK